MFDILFIGILVSCSVILGIEGIKKWREFDQPSFLVGAVFAILAGLIFIVDWFSGFYALGLAMLIRIVAGFTSKRAESDQMEGNHKADDTETR